MPSTAVICCCSSVNGTGVDGIGVGTDEAEGPVVVAPETV